MLFVLTFWLSLLYPDLKCSFPDELLDLAVFSHVSYSFDSQRPAALAGSNLTHRYPGDFQSVLADYHD
jgi:hypothetical protein